MITISESSGGAFIRCEGEFNAQELFDARRELHLNFPMLSTWHFVVLDLSETTSLNVHMDQIERLALQDVELSKLMRPGLLVAIVAPHDFYFGVARMWQSVVDDTGFEILIVRDPARVAPWLQERIAKKFKAESPDIVIQSRSAL